VSEQLFISDLHLSPERPAISRLFQRFLWQRAAAASALYILGDLFDAWIGDDAEDACSRATLDALGQLSAGGCALYLQQGNRDFLLGEAFANQCGAQLIAEEHCLPLAGSQALLLHGDLLCSDDTEYQQARRMLRNPAFIQDFLAKPVEVRRQLAADYRRRSGEAISLKASDIMDVNPRTVDNAMNRHQVKILVHGHTHRPGDHWLGERRRIVLGQWLETGARILVNQGDDLRLIHYR
jgi:UDP-2,3-diacylglucosamine hydrolase